MARQDIIEVRQELKNITAIDQYFQSVKLFANLEEMKNVKDDILRAVKGDIAPDTAAAKIRYSHFSGLVSEVLITKVCFNLDQIAGTYKKYKVSSMDELANDFANKFNAIDDKKEIIDNEFIKNLAVLLNKPNPNDVLFDDRAFKMLYEDIIDMELYDPNYKTCNNSVLFFMMLPERPELLATNAKVFENPNINWDILVNGTHPLKRMILKLKECKRTPVAFLYYPYYSEAIMNALKGSCSVTTTYRRLPGYDESSEKDDYSSIVDRLTKNAIKEQPLVYELLNDMELPDSIREYLLSTEGFRKQTEVVRIDCPETRGAYHYYLTMYKLNKRYKKTR